MQKINIVRIASILYALIGAGALIGWFLHVPQLMHIFTVIIIVATAILVLLTIAVHYEQAFAHINSQLHESENRFRLAFDNAAIGVALLSPDGTFIKVNHALCQIAGYSENELLNMTIRKLVYPDDFKKEFPQIKKILNGETKTYQAAQRCFNKKGEIVWVMASVSLVRNDDNEPVYFIAQFQDINTERKSEERLRHMAYHDSLTGLANRNRLEQHLNELIVISEQQHETFAIIILDLDYFKNINDSLGHDAGDELLQVVAERIKNTVRSKDVVARVGGDEFVIVIRDAKKAEIIAQIAQKILYNLFKPIVIKSRELYVTTSIGVSVFPYDGKDMETLMKNADLALYRAKEKGRNNFQFCTSDMTKKAREKIERKNALNHALIKDEFLLHYQPAIDVKTKEIVSVEALLRWQSKDYGFVAPDSIISTAEETGLIVPLSDWILRTACKQVKEWHETENPNLTLSINLSPRQFKDVSFIKNILSILSATEFPADKLVIEITESLIMHDPDNTMKTISLLKSSGIAIAIDDFGTGFSSFTYLTNYSVDKIKIDKSFTQKITSDTSHIAVISAMIAMANKLKIKAVAEGVETMEQYNILEKEGCDEMQGYYISKPLPIDLMETVLKNKIKLHTTDK